VTRLRFGIILAAVFLGCSSFNESAAISGQYELTKVNGNVLPADCNTVVFGATGCLSGSSQVGSDQSFTVRLGTSKGSIQTSGLITTDDALNNYTFLFADGTSGKAIFGGSAFTLTYTGNVFIFKKI
jgi:hypothetical protein